MPHVITQSCCADASCVVACPVNCIHPAPGEPDFGTTEMLYVDPLACVDCGACVTACPVDAIKPHSTLRAEELPFIELNRLYYVDHPHEDRTPLQKIPRRRRLPTDGVRVAVIGAGPAGLFAADELLRHPGLEVDVFDKLPTPYGLVRAGVAPDHQLTKKVKDYFHAIEEQSGFTYRLGVELGRDVSLEELRTMYHAVIYAGGASAERRLDVPGEDLLGSIAATEFVGWYNGNPAHQDAAVDLGGERVVVVGNGNVALDVARMLCLDPDELAPTDIAELPLAALRGSSVREVVVVGRRGPAQAAFTMPELIGLAGLRTIDIRVDLGGAELDLATAKGRLLAELAARPPRPDLPRIVLRFCAQPVRILGEDRVTGIELERTRLETVDGLVRAVATGETETLEASVVVRSVGHRTNPVPGFPHDAHLGLIPNQRGRVEPGLYVAGWAKRGSTGHIGTNKFCSEETVDAMLDDLAAGSLDTPVYDRAQVERLLTGRVPRQVGVAGWRRIDAEEERLGAEAGRVRAKFVDVEQMHDVAESAPPVPTRRRTLGLLSRLR